MTTIDKARAVELIEQAVKTHGADYVDPDAAARRGCWYTHGDQPGCIVGTAYFLAGATIDQVVVLDTGDGGCSKIDETPEVLIPLETDDEALAVFRAAQDAQDHGSTWGAALVAARRVAEGVAA